MKYKTVCLPEELHAQAKAFTSNKRVALNAWIKALVEKALKKGNSK